MDTMFLVILFVFFIAVIHIEGMLICPLGWEEFDDACYFLNHAARVDYEEAEDACSSFGANLTTIYSMEEQDFLASRVQDIEDRQFQFYYIGLNDKEEENMFVWSDGTQLGFEYWGSGQPNNYQNDQHCVGLKPSEDGTWNDIGCNNRQAYICEQDKDMPACPVGWENFQDVCYLLKHDARVTYEVADTTCRSMSAILTTIPSSEVQNFLGGRIQEDEDRDYHFYYIGLNDKENENIFVWSDGTQLHLYWGSNQPNNWEDRQDCVALEPSEGSAWNDIDCSTNHAYICQRYRVSDMCVDPLGMEDGSMQDNQITASNELNGFNAYNARLNSNSAWNTVEDDNNIWIQVEFVSLRSVSGIVTQGDGDSKLYDFWVTRYKVEYKDGVYWQFVKDDQFDNMEFYGNSDRTTYVTNLFASTMIASHIRIRPTEWHGLISMRFEILGCEALVTTTTITSSTSDATKTFTSSTSEATKSFTSSTSNTKTTDSRLSGKQMSSSSAIVTATGVAIAFVLLLGIVGCIVFVAFKRRKQEQDSSQSQTAIQLEGPYGDTVTNVVTSQPMKDTNTYEAAEDYGGLYQDVPDRSGGIPVDHEDTYQDVRDAPTNSVGANDDIYHDIRDAEYDYARVDKKRLIQVPNDDSDHTTSHGNDAPRTGEANQQEGWVDNDIYGRSDEEQPKCQDDEDSNTEGWEDNSIYATSNE